MSSTQKTGGNKKGSSPSDEAYWARAKAAKFEETHKARRIKRHEKRMAKKAAKLIARASRPMRSFQAAA